MVAVGGKRLGTHVRKRAESMTASMAGSMTDWTPRETGNRDACCDARQGRDGLASARRLNDFSQKQGARPVFVLFII